MNSSDNTIPIVALSGDPLDTRLTQENECFAVAETLVQHILESAQTRQWILLVPWYMMRKPQEQDTSTSGAGMESLASVLERMETATKSNGGGMTIRIITDEEAMQMFETRGRAQVLLSEANELINSYSSVEFQTVPGQHYPSNTGSHVSSETSAGHNSFTMAKRRLGIEAGLDVQALLVLGGSDPMSYAEADLACALHCGLATRFVPLNYTDPIKNERKEQAKGAYGLAQELGIYQYTTETKGVDQSVPWRSDNGSCLTMHQPWASLVVYGIKRAEGRPWRSNFSGVLWIHAAAREPLESEIEHIEQQYREVYGDRSRKLEVPKSYPTSCLLGCVYVPAVLDQSSFHEFTSQAGLESVQAESTSEHVFLCEKPHRLVAPFSLEGSNKIWNLSKSKPELASLQRGLRAVKGPDPVDFSELLREFKTS